MNGILNVLKPTNMTSHDVVNYIRKTLNCKKVGHSGTLDPNASGVLLICLGKTTKMSEYIMNGDKEYVCELILGSSTDTQDMYGQILNEKDFIFDVSEIEKVVNSFKGIQYQKPPMYSALKYKGKKLYEYARKNITIDKPARQIEIKDIKILKCKNNKLLLKICCSKGTYIRTICNDIGLKLNTYGHMGILIRTKNKSLCINESLTLQQIAYLHKVNKIKDYIISIDKVIKLEKIYIPKEYYSKLVNGNEVFAKTSIINTEPFYIICDDKLIGIGKKISDNTVKINKMLRERYN